MWSTQHDGQSEARALYGSQLHCEHGFLLRVVINCSSGPGLYHDHVAHLDTKARLTSVDSPRRHSNAKPVGAPNSFCTLHFYNHTDYLSPVALRRSSRTHKTFLLPFGVYMAAAILDIVDNVVAHNNDALDGLKRGWVGEEEDANSRER